MFRKVQELLNNLSWTKFVSHEAYPQVARQVLDFVDQALSGDFVAFYREELSLHAYLLQLWHRGDTEIRLLQRRLAHLQAHPLLQPMGR